MTMHTGAAYLAEVPEEQAARVDMIRAAREIWEEKYQLRSLDGESEGCIGESWPRVTREAPSHLGFTYKTSRSGLDYAIYITINDVVAGERRFPCEVFINSKALEHYAWTVTLTRLLSAIRPGGDVAILGEKLRAVFDPQGGSWSKGVYLPSVAAHIGAILKHHLRSSGYLPLLEGGGLKGYA